MKPNKYVRFFIRLLKYLFGFTGFAFIVFFFQCRFPTPTPISKILISKPSKVMVQYSLEAKEKTPKYKYMDPLEEETITKAGIDKILRNNKKLRQQLLIYEGNLTQQNKQALHYLRKICPEGIVRRYLEWRLYRPEYIALLEDLEMLLQLNQEPLEQEMKDFKTHILVFETHFLNLCSILRKQDFIITQINRNISVSERERLESLFHDLEHKSTINYISYLESLKTLQQSLSGLEEMPLDFFEMTFVHHWFKKAQPTEQNKKI